MNNFTSTESAFYDFLRGQGYAHSTSCDYVRRIRKVDSIDTLLGQNLTPYIEDYTVGSHENMNKSTHNAYSCALKRLQEMQAAKGIL